jgi:hypothetical protein
MPRYRVLAHLVTFPAIAPLSNESIRESQESGTRHVIDDLDITLQRGAEVLTLFEESPQLSAF